MTRKTPTPAKGTRFGRLIIIKEITPLDRKIKSHDGKVRLTYRRRILCICDCGNKKKVNLDSLTAGDTQSCGCLASELTIKRQTTHGLTKNPLYRVYHCMMDDGSLLQF